MSRRPTNTCIEAAAPPLRLALAGIALALAMLPACASTGRAPDDESPSQDQNRPLAQIDGATVHWEDFQDFLRLNAEAGELGFEGAGRVRLFEEFVVEHLLLRRAEEAGVGLTREEVENALRRWAPGARESEPMRARVRRFLKAQKVLRQHVDSRVEVTRQEVRRYYNRNYMKFEAGDRVHVLEILVEDRELAERLRRQLEPGDARAFREAARRHSKGATAGRGGDLGVVEQGTLPPDFEKAIFELKAGEISGVFRSGHGYHLFMAEELVPRHHQKFYEVQKEIYLELLAKKERRALEEFLKQIIRDASISIHDEELRSEWRKRHAEALS